MNTPFTVEDFAFLREIFCFYVDEFYVDEGVSQDRDQEGRADELFGRLHTIMTEVSALAMAHQQLKEKA